MALEFFLDCLYLAHRFIKFTAFGVTQLHYLFLLTKMEETTW